MTVCRCGSASPGARDRSVRHPDRRGCGPPSPRSRPCETVRCPYCVDPPDGPGHPPAYQRGRPLPGRELAELRPPLTDRRAARDAAEAQRTGLWFAVGAALGATSLSSQPWAGRWLEEIRRAGTVGRQDRHIATTILTRRSRRSPHSSPARTCSAPHPLGPCGRVWVRSAGTPAVSRCSTGVASLQGRRDGPVGRAKPSAQGIVPVRGSRPGTRCRRPASTRGGRQARCAATRGGCGRRWGVLRCRGGPSCTTRRGRSPSARARATPGRRAP